MGDGHAIVLYEGARCGAAHACLALAGLYAFQHGSVRGFHGSAEQNSVGMVWCLFRNGLHGYARGDFASGMTAHTIAYGKQGRLDYE
jgi:hypothetical protein